VRKRGEKKRGGACFFQAAKKTAAKEKGKRVMTFKRRRKKEKKRGGGVELINFANMRRGEVPKTIAPIWWGVRREGEKTDGRKRRFFSSFCSRRSGEEGKKKNGARFEVSLEEKKPKGKGKRREN